MTGYARATLVGAMLAPGLACAGTWGGSASLASDDVYRGLTQSDNAPTAGLDGHYYAEAGWFMGLGATGVYPRAGNRKSVLLEPYLGYQRPLSADWSLRGLAVRHDFVGSDRYDHYNYDELTATLAYADRASFSFSVSPDAAYASPYVQVSGRTVLAYDLAFHQPLLRGLNLNAGAGYSDLRFALHGGYAYWNGGLGYVLGKVQFDLSYIGTSEAARTLFYNYLAVNRVVGSVVVHF